jgi:hypothetical protein
MTFYSLIHINICLGCRMPKVRINIENKNSVLSYDSNFHTYNLYGYLYHHLSQAPSEEFIFKSKSEFSIIHSRVHCSSVSRLYLLLKFVRSKNINTISLHSIGCSCLDTHCLSIHNHYRRIW